MTFEEPNSPVLEEHVLSSLCANGAEALAAAFNVGLTAEAFTAQFRRSVFAVLRDLSAAGLAAEPALLWERLSAVGPVDGEQFVRVTQPTTTLTLANSLRELIELQRVRATKREAQRLLENAGDPAERQNSINRLLQVQTGGTTARPWRVVLSEAMDRAKLRIAGTFSEADAGLSFGRSALDKRFKPMRRGELVVVGARPSGGKSSLSRQICESTASDGKTVAMFSLEVGPDDIADAMASAASGHASVELPSLHHADQQEFLDALERLREAPLHIFEDRSLAGMISRSKCLHATTGLDLVCVDYLGLISDCSPERGELKTQAIGRVTGALKRLAMELNCVVILLAQLNRGSVKDGNREPVLSDLRDSGDIEQDADRVIFIHRPDTCPIRKIPQDILSSVEDLPRYGVQIFQAKGRNVGTASAALWFNRRLARFELNSAVQECIL